MHSSMTPSLVLVPSLLSIVYHSAINSVSLLIWSFHLFNGRVPLQCKRCCVDNGSQRHVHPSSINRRDLVKRTCESNIAPCFLTTSERQNEICSCKNSKLTFSAKKNSLFSYVIRQIKNNCAVAYQLNLRFNE